ncbi:MAG TPA: hypothetical protein VFV73_27720 [Streptosporangiaceae bacterium]|nr:hypothetical protein [Streptosporangiaceae bacterium]
MSQGSDVAACAGAATPAVSRALLGLAQAYADVLEAGFRADLGRLVSHVEARLGARLAATGLAFGHFAMLAHWAAEGAPATCSSGPANWSGTSGGSSLRRC